MYWMPKEGTHISIFIVRETWVEDNKKYRWKEKEAELHISMGRNVMLPTSEVVTVIVGCKLCEKKDSTTADCSV